MILTAQTTNQIWITIIALCLTNFLIRALPFIIFKNRPIPKFIIEVGNLLPYAVIIILVVYSIKDPILKNSFPSYELIAVLVVAILQYFKKNMVLSIFVGTALYVLLVNIF